MKGKLGRTVALMGLSAALVSCALILGEGGQFDEQGIGGAKTTSGESTAASISGAPGDTSISTASDVTSSPSGPSTTSGMNAMSSSASMSASGPTSTSTTSTSSGGPTTCGPGSVADLADDFSDPSSSQTRWNNDAPANVSYTGGALVLKSTAEVYSKKTYKLLDCHASVKVTGLGAGAGDVHLNVKNSDTNKQIQINAEARAGGYITFEAAGSQVIPNCPYDPSKHVYWRILATGTDVYLQTADKSGKWNDQPCDNGVAKMSLAAVGFDTGKVEVHMGVSGVTSPISFDDFDKP